MIVLNRNIFIVFAMFSFLFISCKRAELNRQEFINWVENQDNGFRKAKKIEDIKFEILYKPYEYIVLKEGNEIVENNEQLNNGIKELGEMQYFTFKISNTQEIDPLKYNMSSKEEYFNRIKYYSFDIQPDIELVEGADTLKCELAHFERNFGVSPEIVVLLGFEKSRKKNEDKTFIYNDKIFDCGPVQINISSSDIGKLPKLKI